MGCLGAVVYLFIFHWSRKITWSPLWHVIMWHVVALDRWCHDDHVYLTKAAIWGWPCHDLATALTHVTLNSLFSHSMETILVLLKGRVGTGVWELAKTLLQTCLLCTARILKDRLSCTAWVFLMYWDGFLPWECHPWLSVWYMTWLNKSPLLLKPFNLQLNLHYKYHVLQEKTLVDKSYW